VVVREMMTEAGHGHGTNLSGLCRDVNAHGNPEERGRARFDFVTGDAFGMGVALAIAFSEACE
jgi:hypothetical protein